VGSLFTELKRRKVVRVAVVYAATAFVVLQAADIMLASAPGGVPEWAMSLVVCSWCWAFIPGAGAGLGAGADAGRGAR
jgi:hypothetical protein